MNWLLIVKLRARALHYVCACVTVVLGFIAHSIISSYVYDDVDGYVPNDEDRYDCLGYGSDFKEFLDEYYD